MTGRRHLSPVPPGPARASAARRAGRAADGAAWYLVGAAYRYPVRVAAFGASLAASPALTLRDVAGVVVGGAAYVAGSCAVGARARARALSLHRDAKRRKHRARMRRLIRRRWVTVTRDAGMVRAARGLTPERAPGRPRITDTPLGLAVTFDASRVSATVDDVAHKIHKFRSAFKCPDIRLSSPTPGRVRMDLRYDDPFRRVVRLGDLPVSTTPLHVITGQDDDAAPVERDLRLPSLWIGAQGAGKSTELVAILRAAQLAGVPLRLRVFDPKGGMEFGDFGGAVYDYEDDPGRWPAFLERAHRALAARQAALKRARVRESVATWSEPLDVMVIDELLTVLAFAKGAKVRAGGSGDKVSAELAFMQYLSVARAAGFTVEAASQLSQKSTIGDIRDLFAYVSLLRVASDDIVDTVLGPGASKLYPAHRLSAAKGDAGIGYLWTSRGGVRKYRGALLTDAERRDLIRHTRESTARFRAATKTEPKGRAA